MRRAPGTHEHALQAAAMSGLGGVRWQVAWNRAPNPADEALWRLVRAAVAAGVTPGPGRGPSDFERMQRRHQGAAATSALLHSLASMSAWHQPAIRLPGQAVRAFNKRVEVRSAWECLPASAYLGSG